MTVARYTSSDAHYAIDRADTITFQYPNGLQTQIVERSMWIRLIIGPGIDHGPHRHHARLHSRGQRPARLAHIR